MLIVLKQLITTIVTIIMLALMLEVMIPSGDMQRYVKMILGLLIILMVLTPVLKFLKKDFDYGSKMLDVKNDIELESIMAMGEKLAKQDQENIIEKFRKSLGEQVRAQLLKIQGLKKVEVNVSVEEDITSGDFGMITGIDVTVVPGNRQTSGIRQVDEVKIRINENAPVEGIAPELEEAVVERIIKLYGISPDAIHVNVKKE